MTMGMRAPFILCLAALVAAASAMNIDTSLPDNRNLTCDCHKVFADVTIAQYAAFLDAIGDMLGDAKTALGRSGKNYTTVEALLVALLFETKDNLHAIAHGVVLIAGAAGRLGEKIAKNVEGKLNSIWDKFGALGSITQIVAIIIFVIVGGAVGSAILHASRKRGANGGGSGAAPSNVEMSEAMAMAVLHAMLRQHVRENRLVFAFVFLAFVAAIINACWIVASMISFLVCGIIDMIALKMATPAADHFD